MKQDGKRYGSVLSEYSLSMYRTEELLMLQHLEILKINCFAIRYNLKAFILTY